MKDLALDGKVLMTDLAVKPGPEIGRILRALLEEVVDDPTLNTKDTLVQRARDLLQKSG